LAWLLPSGYVETQAEWWVTAANIEGQENICPIVAPGDPSCTTSMTDAVKRMRGAKLDTFVRQDEGPAVEYHRTANIKARRPARVAVLIDTGCASSCEQFLLAVRQSFSAKLIGLRSAGNLDYSNLRPHELPSGKRRLWYATSRSMRLPFFPVDGIGVQLDIQVPIDGLLNKVRDADQETRASMREAFMREEVTRVQRWLKGGAIDFGEDVNSR
jgi:C-terminal processing protease CtpA/Prc